MKTTALTFWRDKEACLSLPPICNWEVVVVPTFFLAYFILSASIIGDFGSGWDEVHNRRFGMIAINDIAYMCQEKKAIVPNINHATGTAFAMTVAAAEIILGLDTSYEAGKESDSHLLYHWMNFLYFFCAAICFYFLSKSVSSNWLVAMIGILLLVTQPRIFHHSFHNQKDVAFLSASIFAMYTLHKFHHEKSAKNALLHGICCAIAIDIRIVAIALPVATILGSVLLPFLSDATRIKRNLHAATFCVSTIAFTILFWPMLWLNPIENFLWAIQKSCSIGADFDVLYFGKYFSSGSLPWHYNLTLIALTTPLVYLALSFLGIALFLKSFISASTKRLTDDVNFYTCLFLWLAAPLIAPMILSTELYDGWRHHYFVYPILVLFAVLAISKLMEMANSYTSQLAIFFTLVAAVVLVAIHGVWLHPYQNVYFNSLSRVLPIKQTDVGHSFDMDYWGLTYREGLEYLSSNTTGNITVFAYPAAPAHRNHIWLPKTERERITLVGSIHDAEYFISNYRWKASEFPSGYGYEVYSIFRQGKKILTVRRRDGALQDGKYDDVDFVEIKGVNGF